MFRNPSSLLLHYHHTIISSYVIIQRCTIHHRKYLYLCRSDLIAWSTISPVSCQNPPDRFFNQSQDLSSWANEIHPNILSHWHQKLTVNDPSRVGSNVGKTDEKKQNINFFMSSVLFTVLTLPLNMIPLWTKLTVKIQQVFLLPSRFLVLVWHLGESLYPTISKNKTSESSSLSKQIKLNDINILSWKISSILWTSSKSPYICIQCSGVWIAALNLFHYPSRLKE